MDTPNVPPPDLEGLIPTPTWNPINALKPKPMDQCRVTVTYRCFIFRFRVVLEQGEVWGMGYRLKGRVPFEARAVGSRLN